MVPTVKFHNTQKHKAETERDQESVLKQRTKKQQQQKQQRKYDREQTICNSITGQRSVASVRQSHKRL